MKPGDRYLDLENSQIVEVKNTPKKRWQLDRRLLRIQLSINDMFQNEKEAEMMRKHLESGKSIYLEIDNQFRVSVVLGSEVKVDRSDEVFASAYQPPWKGEK